MIALLFALNAYASSAMPVKMPDPAISWESAKHPERKAWSAQVYALIDELEPKLNKAKDLSRFGHISDKRKLWAEIFAAMTYFESGWNRSKYYMEPPPLSRYSIGLFQLSYSDRNYSFCRELDEVARNLEVARVNLNCGIRIFAHWVERDGYITTPANKGAARYWSVLREKRKLPDVIARVKKNL